MIMTPLPPAGLFRRIAAGVYDLLLLAALLMLAGFGAVALLDGNPVPPGSLSFQLSVLLVAGGFYVGFWHRGGQTLGMAAWRLRVETHTGNTPDIGTCVRRFLGLLLSLIPLGAGIWWMLFDVQRQTWHDRLSGTRVVLLPKRK